MVEDHPVKDTRSVTAEPTVVINRETSLSAPHWRKPWVSHPVFTDTPTQLVGSFLLLVVDSSSGPESSSPIYGSPDGVNLAHIAFCVTGR